MITGIPLTLVLTFIILAFFAMDFYFMAQFDPQRQRSGKGWGWRFTLLSIAMALAIILQPVLLPGISWSTNSAPGAVIQVVGAIMVLTSFGLHIWARVHLRQFYVERVEVQPEHRVVQTGPYALMRHPIISSFFLLAGGIFLVNPAITTAFVLFYTFWDFLNSAQREERLLSASVPGYKAYMERTPPFMPRLWGKRQ